MLSTYDSIVLSEAEIAKRELVLLLLAFLFVAMNHTALILLRHLPLREMWPLGVWLICAVGAHAALCYTLPKRDPLILPIVLLLSGWGLTLVARLAPLFATRQTIWLAVSVGAALAVTLLPPSLRVLQRYRYTWLLIGIGILGATLIFGVNPSGAETQRLWLGFWGVYFQPSEVLKLLLVIFVASYLADKRELIATTQFRIGLWRLPALTYLAPMMLMWGFCMVLLIWQRDLGAASLFFIVFLAMLYVSTEEPTYPLLGVFLLLMGGVVGYRLFGVVRLRVDMWWNPWLDPDNLTYQIVQSLMAVAAGGVFGQGVGQGLPTAIPVVHSDFVFAAIAEEWGLVGSLAVVVCIVILVMRALRIAAQNVRRPFRSLLAVGISLLIALQSLLIMGGVLKLVPLTGVTLPFVSYGGSSLLSSFIMIGLLLRLSDPTTRPNHRQEAPEFVP